MAAPIPPLASLLENMSDGVLMVDRGGTILYASPVATRILGFEAAEFAGRPIFEFHHPGDAERTRAQFQELAAAPGRQATVRIRARHKDGSWRWIESTRKNMLDDPAVGTIVVTFRDISATFEDEVARERRRQHTDFLEEFTRDFSRYQDPPRLFAAVAERTTTLLGDWCAILRIVPGDRYLHLEALYHTDHGKAARMRALAEAAPTPSDDPVLGRIIAGRRPVVMASTDPEIRRMIREIPAAATAFAELGIAAALVVPIYVTDQPIGLLNIGSDAPRRWDDDELRLATLVADRAGAAIQNARLIDAERAARRDAEHTTERTIRLQRLTAALSEATTVRQVADVIVGRGAATLGATTASLSLLANDGDTLEMIQAVGYPPEVMSAWRSAHLSQRMVAADAIRRREPIFAESRDALLARYPEAPLLPVEGPWAVVPLAVGTQVTGTMSFTFPPGRALHEEDRALIVTLADLGAQALERGRLYERERTAAETLQRSLLPPALPQPPGIRVAARYLPAGPETRIGGDWYDAVALPDGRMGLAIGDVSGHGIPAASVMARLRNALRAYAMDLGAPEDIMQRLSRLVEHNESATVLYLVLDPVARTLTYANAGHLPPLLVTPDGRGTFLEGASIALCRLHALYTPFTAAVPDGSTLLLYTDGLVENRARRSIDDGMARLRTLAEEAHGTPPEQLVERILAGLTADRALEDDVAVMAVSLDVVAGRPLSLRSPALPESIPMIRVTLWRWLATLGAGAAESQEVIAAVTEACNNAIEHAYNPASAEFTLEGARRDDEIVILVRDEGGWHEPRSGRGGFGFAVMRGLMDTVDVDRGATGTTITLRRRLKGRAPA